MKKLNLRGVDLNLLTIFEAIMDTGQLSLAGERLGLSQPAVSSALQRLRLTLDDPLFVRTRHGMQPTPRAQTLHQQLAPALAQIRQSIGPHDSDPSQSDRVFTLLAGDYFETVHLAALMERLDSEASRVRVNLLQLSTDGIPADFRRGQQDFAIFYQAPTEPGIEFETVGEEKLVVLCRRDHPRIKRRLGVKQFNAEKHVLISTPNQQSVRLERALGEQHIERNISVSVSHFSSAAMIVESTDALCTVPAGLGEFLQSRFAVKILPLPLPAPAVNKLVMWPSVLANDPLHQWFKQLLIEVMQS